MQTVLPRWRGFNVHNMFYSGRYEPFREEDFKWIADWGFDYVRISVAYQQVVTNGDRYEPLAEQSGLTRLWLSSRGNIEGTYSQDDLQLLRYFSAEAAILVRGSSHDITGVHLRLAELPKSPRLSVLLPHLLHRRARHLDRLRAVVP